MEHGLKDIAFYVQKHIYTLHSCLNDITWAIHTIPINSSPPSAIYMCQWIRSALVQIMACRLFGAKPLYLNQCWFIVNRTLGNKLQWNFNQNTKPFSHENAFENIFCEKPAILFMGDGLTAPGTGTLKAGTCITILSSDQLDMILQDVSIQLAIKKNLGPLCEWISNFIPHFTGHVTIYLSMMRLNMRRPVPLGVHMSKSPPFPPSPPRWGGVVAN